MARRSTGWRTAAAVLLATTLWPGASALAQGGQFQRHRGLIEPVEPEDGEFTRAITRPLNEAYDAYNRAERRLLDPLGMRFDMQVSQFTQWGNPRGGRPTSLFVYSPNLDWNVFSGSAFGSGTFSVSAQGAQFWSAYTASDQQTALGTLTPQNGWSRDSFAWEVVSYTHRFPGAMSWLTVTGGQFGIAGFDGDYYAGNPQTSFVSFALSQNATQTYPVAGLGAYATATVPGTRLSFTAGFQGATDVLGRSITTAGFSEGKYATFANVLWTPIVPGLGRGSYNLLLYAMPAVPAQPARSQGVSFAMSQRILPGLGIFARFANATGDVVPIETSAAAGVVLRDPFRRNSRDQLGLGLFVNRANPGATVGAPATTRRTEWGGEVFYNFVVARGLTVTPTLAVFVNPVFAPGSDAAGVLTLRSTAFF